MLYWDSGKQIAEKQENAAWGSGFINQLSKDLKNEFPDMVGFSANNSRYCKSFHLFYSSDNSICAQLVRKLKNNVNQSFAISEQLVPKLDIKSVSEENLNNKLIKIPWGHHILILKKIKDIKEAIFYTGKIRNFLKI